MNSHQYRVSIIDLNHKLAVLGDIMATIHGK